MQPPAPKRLFISAVALLCVLYSVAGVGVAIGEVTEPAAGPVEEVPQQTTPTNNTSVQQEDPDDVNEQGDPEAVRSYLAKKLAERLGQSSVQISQGQYEQGQSVLGDEYDALLEQYVDVEGEGGDSPAAESFRETSENQREYGSTVQQYNETYQEYRAAKQAGNSTRARALARELNRLAEQANRSGQNLTRSYTRVENTTGADLSNATANVENTSEEIADQQATVVSETFVRTNLSATANASVVSFENPATIHGRLLLENGTALGNQTIEITTGGRTETVQTDREGRFSFDYRPVQQSQDVEAVSVTYLPAESSMYLGATTSVDVNVTQVTADLTVSTNTTSMQFGDQVAVSGVAQVNGTPVPGARIRVRVGGRTIGTAVTDASGTYRLTGALSASVPTGDATVQAVIVPGDRAVRSDAATTNVQVKSTAVSLSVNATQLTDSRLQLSGVFRTADGRPLGGQEIELRVAGSTVATVETRQDGTFERTVPVRESLSGTVTVRAVYDEPSTNLEQASAQSSVALDAGAAEEEEGSLPVAPELLGGGGIVVLAVLIIGWFVRGEENGAGAGAVSSPTPTESSTAEESEPSGAIVAEASSLLSAGDSAAAIRALYAAVRTSIGTDGSGQTHWEFYTAASDRLDGEAVGTLERLTEAYEQVVYSTDEIEDSVAEELLDESEHLIDEGSTEVRNAD